jgi:hypothetical protein
MDKCFFLYELKTSKDFSLQEKLCEMAHVWNTDKVGGQH